MNEFAKLGLSDDLLKAVSEAGYSQPTPIQEKAIPPILMNKDILGCAQTGTGKTAGFTLPILQGLASNQGPRTKGNQAKVLILTPTRELATQVMGQLQAMLGRKTKIKSATGPVKAQRSAKEFVNRLQKTR